MKDQQANDTRIEDLTAAVHRRFDDLAEALSALACEVRGSPAPPRSGPGLVSPRPSYPSGDEALEDARRVLADLEREEASGGGPRADLQRAVG